jgi:tRNA pseudouridine55 synthase
MAGSWRPLNGVLLFDKPLELSSNIALQKVRRLFQAEKAGHTGTLDPLATGLLPICFGEATKFSFGLLEADKTYQAEIKLGQTTTTGDAEGEITATLPVSVTVDQIEQALQSLRGEIKQLPPMYSALKHQGKPLYEYIRKGETIERELRTVFIHELVVEQFAADKLSIRVRCSKGTYVRTLAEDIGQLLGCGAHLIGLRRTSIANFSLDNAYTLSQLEAMNNLERDNCLLPLDCMVMELPRLDLDSVQLGRLAQGQRLGMDLSLPEGKLRLYLNDEFVGLADLLGRRVSPSRLLSSVARSAATVQGRVAAAEAGQD